MDLIPIDHYEIICRYIKNGIEELGDIQKLATCLNDEYEIDWNKIEEIQFNYGSLEDFVSQFKALALEIKWDAFFKRHEKFYEELIEQFSDFPENFDLQDFNCFYGVNNHSFYYVPSILINGGMGFKDKENRFYYMVSIRYNKSKKKFTYNKLYLVECLFHEFLHSIVNHLVDKYFDLFQIDELYEYSV